jgi:C4-dicarboxylate transporter DctM subunit
MIVVAFAGIFGTLATNYNMSKVILNLSTLFMGNKYIIMLFISVILFVAGMFIDSNAAMLMLVPVFSPLILQYGFDPIYFAMVCILTLDMGGMSPPVGLLMYIASSITDTPLAKTVKQIWSFLAVNYGVTILVIFVPAIVTLLPALFG